MNRSKATRVVGLGLGVVAVGVSWMELAAGEEDAGPLTSLNADKQALEQAEQLLDRVNEAAANDPERHAAIEKAKAAEKKSHEAELATKPEALDEWPTGIFDDPEAPASGTTFLGSNRWVGLVDGAYLVVYAGRSGADPTTGMILAFWSDGRPGYSLYKPGTGALTVVSARDAALTLRDEGGRTHVLHALAGQWAG